MKKLFFMTLCGFIISGCSAKKDKNPEIVVKKEDPQKLIENLFVAVLNSDEQSVQTLLENPDTDLSAYDERGQTALMRAVQIDSSPYIVELLIASGAKIYQPRKDSKKTAFDDLNPSNVALSKLFSKEKERISKSIEEIILNENFKLATQFVQDNHLPYHLNLSETERNPLKLALKTLSSNSNEGKSFITQELARFVEAGEDVLFIMKHGWPLTTQIKDILFLENLLTALKSNSNSNFSVLRYLEGDFEDVNWLIQKMNLVTEYGFRLPVTGYTDSFILQLNASQKNGLKEPFLSLNKALQNSSTDDSSKSLILQQVLFETEKSLKTSPDRIKWISTLISDWKSGRQSIKATGHRFDDHTWLILKALAGKEVILPELDDIFTQMALFAPDFENRSEESIQFIINTDEYEFIDKKRILKMLLQRVHIFPEQIVSYAIEHGGISAIELLLKTDLPFSLKFQDESVLTAIKKTKSGDAAYEILVLLSENGVAFNTDYGKQALNLVIAKLWGEDNATYRSVYDYLISLPHSPVTAMTDSEIISSLKSLLNFARSGKANWPQVTQFVERIQNPITEASLYQVKSIKFGSETDDSKTYDLEVSFLWDFLMAAYDMTKSRPSEMGLMLVTARKVAEKFPHDHFSFSFVGEPFFQSADLVISQNILPLAVLFTIDKSIIKEALLISDEFALSRAVEPAPNYFSWKHFLNGQPYHYYSQNKNFWTSIVHILLESGRKHLFHGNKDHVLFAKVLMHSGKLKSFPQLESQLKDLDASVFDHQKACVVKKRKYDQAHLQQLNAKHNNGTTGSPPSWVSLGLFEILIPVKDKTCSSQKKMKTSEVQLIRSLIENGLDPYQKPIESNQNPLHVLTPQKTKTCTPANSPATKNFIVDYDIAGSVLKRTEANSTSTEKEEMLMVDSPYGEMCYIFEYNDYAAYKAKTVFLNNWFQCAIDSGDDVLVRIFETLDSTHNIKPTHENEGIHFCRW